jgi:hypothetical protein
MKTLQQQVNGILHAKVAAIAKDAFKKANPNPYAKKWKPYTLPQCAHDMVAAMLGRIDVATDAELEAMAHFATTGEVFERTTK